jgi:hypothetical protein
MAQWPPKIIERRKLRSKRSVDLESSREQLHARRQCRRVALVMVSVGAVLLAVHPGWSTATGAGALLWCGAWLLRHLVYPRRSSVNCLRC